MRGQIRLDCVPNCSHHIHSLTGSGIWPDLSKRYIFLCVQLVGARGSPCSGSTGSRNSRPPSPLTECTENADEIPVHPDRRESLFLPDACLARRHGVGLKRRGRGNNTILKNSWRRIPDDFPSSPCCHRGRGLCQIAHSPLHFINT